MIFYTHFDLQSRILEFFGLRIFQVLPPTKTRAQCECKAMIVLLNYRCSLKLWKSKTKKMKGFLLSFHTSEALACNCLAYCCSQKEGLCCPFSNAVICCKAPPSLSEQLLYCTKKLSPTPAISKKYRFSKLSK